VFFDPHVVTDAIIVMMPMFAAAVMTVDPMMAMLRPMTGHPYHFVVTAPVTRAVAVVRPITNFDANPCRLSDGPESEARAQRHEQY
jgi:hypothetical protein